MNTSLLRCAALVLVLCLCPVPRTAAQVPVTEDEKITLPKFEVKGNAICSYGIGVTVRWNKQTNRITHLYIDAVNPGSPADKLGLQRGDEILSLNGKKIADLKGGTKSGGELFDLLVNQPVGRMIDVEVTVRMVKKIVLTATP